MFDILWYKNTSRQKLRVCLSQFHAGYESLALPCCLLQPRRTPAQLPPPAAACPPRPPPEAWTAHAQRGPTHGWWAMTYAVHQLHPNRPNAQEMSARQDPGHCNAKHRGAAYVPPLHPTPYCSWVQRKAQYAHTHVRITPCPVPRCYGQAVRLVLRNRVLHSSPRSAVGGVRGYQSDERLASDGCRAPPDRGRRGPWEGGRVDGTVAA